MKKMVAIIRLCSSLVCPVLMIIDIMVYVLKLFSVMDIEIVKYLWLSSIIILNILFISLSLVNKQEIKMFYPKLSRIITHKLYYVFVTFLSVFGLLAIYRCISFVE